MARKLPVINSGDVISYSLGNGDYVSVVIAVSGFDNKGYMDIEIYDLVTPNGANFPPATREDPVQISINPLITKLTVYSFEEYAAIYPEHLL